MIDFTVSVFTDQTEYRVDDMEKTYKTVGRDCGGGILEFLNLGLLRHLYSIQICESRAGMSIV